MTISISNDTLRIDGFSTSNRGIILYFNDIPDSDREGKLEILLQLAILAKDSVGQTISIQHVEDAFDNLRDNMTQSMGEILGSKGEFVQSLETYLGEGGKMQDMLDLTKTDSPLSSLQATIKTEVANIQEEIRTEVMQIMTFINRQKGYEEAAKKGTQKGTEFEERCAKPLYEIAKYYSDIVEPTGTSMGEITSSKKGDFVISVGGTEKRFVMEMKNYSGQLGLKNKLSNLEKSLQNRNADYGVIVSRNRKSLTDEAGWFNEYHGNKLVCALAEDDDDDENMWVIELAYRWARHRVIMAEAEQGEVDPAAIHDSIDKVNASLTNMNNIKAKCTSIKKSAEEIEKLMIEGKEKIESETQKILSTLKQNDK